MNRRLPPKKMWSTLTLKKLMTKKIKEINEAYDVLKDDQKRAAYDRMGHAAFEGGMGGGGGYQQAGGFDFSASGFGNIFDDMFSEFMGGGQGRNAQTAALQGSDL